MRKFIAKAAAAIWLCVLLEGETGTGKTYVARAIHDRGPRVKGPFVGVNSASLSETLLESELFGHEKGAFTDAKNTHHGLIDHASGGTLLLDEIGEMSPGLQARLLTLLGDNRVYRRVGGVGDLRTDARFIFATNMNLLELMARKLFRADLYHRISPLRITLPPLRQRLHDIPAMARILLERHMVAAGASGAAPILSPQALDAFRAYPWPGNIRELANALASALLAADGAPVLQPDHLPSHILSGTPPAPDASPKPRRQRYVPPQDPAEERRMIIEALRLTGWNRTKASAALGMSRRTLWERMRLYRIKESDA
ncbi:MAG: sigma 54-interacting transcriptional regulator [Gemmatimonadota bacterium]